MSDDQDQEKWILYEDGAFISKRNWLVRNWTRAGIIIGLFLSQMFLYFLTVLDILGDASDKIFLTQALNDLETGSIYFAYMLTVLFLAYVSFRIAKFYGNKIFRKYLNDFLIHYKEDWLKK